MSLAPRPCSRPSRSSPNGSTLHGAPPSGTVSRWPVMHSEGRSASVPGQRATRLVRSGACSCRVTSRPAAPSRRPSTSAAIVSFPGGLIVSSRTSSSARSSASGIGALCSPRRDRRDSNPQVEGPAIACAASSGHNAGRARTRHFESGGGGCQPRRGGQHRPADRRPAPRGAAAAARVALRRRRADLRQPADRADRSAHRAARWPSTRTRCTRCCVRSRSAAWWRASGSTPSAARGASTGSPPTARPSAIGWSPSSNRG